MTMKNSPAALWALLSLFAFPVRADELEQTRKLQREVTAAEQRLAERQRHNEGLKRAAATLKRTAEVTRNPPATPEAPPSAPSPTLLFASPLDSPERFTGGNGGRFEVVDLPDGKALKIQSPPGAESVGCPVRVPDSCTIRVSVLMRGENIVKTKPEYFRGARFGAVVKNGERTDYPSAPAAVGTFGWRECFFEARIPKGCINIWLTLGLSGATGTVYLRQLRVEKIAD